MDRARSVAACDRVIAKRDRERYVELRRAYDIFWFTRTLHERYHAGSDDTEINARLLANAEAQLDTLAR